MKSSLFAVLLIPLMGGWPFGEGRADASMEYDKIGLDR